MLSPDKLMQIGRDRLPEAAEHLMPQDITFLVGLLLEKDDKLRYQALLLLQCRSRINNDVYPFMDLFCSKLKSDNSYQRSIGLMLLAENARWDDENRLDAVIDDYLLLLKDEKPITVRQLIQSISLILRYKKQLHVRITSELTTFDLAAVKDTMRKSILTDILGVLSEIRKYEASDEIDVYIRWAVDSGILKKNA